MEWQAYEQVFGPIGPARDDYLAALISLYTSAAMGGKNLTLDKFLPRWGERREDIGGVDQEPPDPSRGDR